MSTAYIVNPTIPVARPVADNSGGHEYILTANSELRFESDRGCCVRLLEGRAEMFGTELTASRLYRMPSCSSSAISTWHGCKIKISGDLRDAYISEDVSALSVYFNLHVHLRNARRRAEHDQSVGPRILIAGSSHVGKSTLCRMLVNWAARDGHEPILVDLDVGQNQLVLPGAIGALLVWRPCQPDDNGWFAEQPACALHFGDADPTQNFPLYEQLIETLSTIVDYRCENNNRSLCAGTIINTCGWIQGDRGYEATLLKVCKSFGVDLVCVIDHERLYSRLCKDSSDCKVLLLPKSGGVVGSSNSGLSSTLRSLRIREYFYGTPSRPLYPHTFSINIIQNSKTILSTEDAELHNVYLVYKLGMDAVPKGCLPIGMDESDHQTRVSQYKDSVNTLIDHVLAISFATDEQKLLNTNIAGYLVVTGTTMSSSNVTDNTISDQGSTTTDTSSNEEIVKVDVISPQPLPLPGRILLFSKIRFVDV